MSTNFARVRRLCDNVIAGIFTFMCLLMMSVNPAPLICKQRLKFDEIGLCSSNGSVTVWHCPSCQPGYGQSVECGRLHPLGTRVGCVLCKSGVTYSDQYDVSQCKPCTQCQKNENQIGQCLQDKDTIQCVCKPGFYRDTHTRDCKPCSWCCGDKTNEHVPECNVPQVPLGKQCSLQTKKLCAPTPPAITTPPAVATNKYTLGTNFTTTEKSSSTTSDPTEIETKSSDAGKSEDKGLSDSDKNSIIIGVFGLLFIIIFILLVVRFCRSQRTTSSAQTSRTTSTAIDELESSGNYSGGNFTQTPTSTANDLDACSSALMLPRDEDLQKSSKGDKEKIHLEDKDGIALYHKVAEKAPPDQLNGGQGKLKHSKKPIEYSLAGTSMSSTTYTAEHNNYSTEKVPLMGASGRHGCQEEEEDLAPETKAMTDGRFPVVGNISNAQKDTEDSRQLSKEEKLDLPVTELPPKIYQRICTKLDTEDPFFKDFRILGEELDFSKEETRVLQKNQTHIILVQSKPNVRKMIEILKEIGIEYLIQDIEEWLN